MCIVWRSEPDSFFLFTLFLLEKLSRNYCILWFVLSNKHHSCATRRYLIFTFLILWATIFFNFFSSSINYFSIEIESLCLVVFLFIMQCASRRLCANLLLLFHRARFLIRFRVIDWFINWLNLPDLHHIGLASSHSTRQNDS